MAQGHAGLFTSGCYVALTEEQIQRPITLHFIFFALIQFRAGRRIGLHAFISTELISTLLWILLRGRLNITHELMEQVLSQCHSKGRDHVYLSSHCSHAY